MRCGHKPAANYDSVRQTRKDYSKYLEQSNKRAGKGIFGELERKKIIKPSILLSNEDVFNPELYNLKTERNLYT